MYHFFYFWLIYPFGWIVVLTGLSCIITGNTRALSPGLVASAAPLACIFLTFLGVPLYTWSKASGVISFIVFYAVSIGKREPAVQIAAGLRIAIVLSFCCIAVFVGGREFYPLVSVACIGAAVYFGILAVRGKVFAAACLSGILLGVILTAPVWVILSNSSGDFLRAIAPFLKAFFALVIGSLAFACGNIAWNRTRREPLHSSESHDSDNAKGKNGRFLGIAGFALSVLAMIVFNFLLS